MKPENGAPRRSQLKWRVNLTEKCRPNSQKCFIDHCGQKVHYQNILKVTKIWNFVYWNSVKITKMYSQKFQIKSSKIAMTMFGCVFLNSIHFGPVLTNLPLFRMANLDALLYKCWQSTETDATKISKTLKTVKLSSK